MTAPDAPTPRSSLSLHPMGGGIHAVTSVKRKRDGEAETATYMVDPNRLSCTCQAGSRGNLCKHVRFVTDYLAGGPSEKVEA